MAAAVRSVFEGNTRSVCKCVLGFPLCWQSLSSSMEQQMESKQHWHQTSPASVRTHTSPWESQQRRRLSKVLSISQQPWRAWPMCLRAQPLPQAARTQADGCTKSGVTPSLGCPGLLPIDTLCLPEVSRWEGNAGNVLHLQLLKLPGQRTDLPLSLFLRLPIIDSHRFAKYNSVP